MYKTYYNYELQLRVLYYHHAGIFHYWNDSRSVWFTVTLAILCATALPPMQLHCKEWQQKQSFFFFAHQNLKFRGVGISHEEMCELVARLGIENALGNYQH